MSSSPQLSFRYRLEQEKPRLGSGGTTRGASVREFPASQGIAGVSMRLEAGSMRELHWHANAAEWGYVVSGNCRTTILHPEGSQTGSLCETDTFGPGDVWYFPRGWGHSIQGIGPGECHFILISIMETSPRIILSALPTGCRGHQHRSLHKALVSARLKLESCQRRKSTLPKGLCPTTVPSSARSAQTPH
jgi:uncharacterized RmlC-like cupin family protein